MVLLVQQAGKKEVINLKSSFNDILLNSSIVFGAVGATACNMALYLKHLLKFDDALDVFAVHGVGGIVGNILTGIFAQKKYADEIQGGWLDGNWMQVVWQLIDTVAALIWSFGVTFLILWIMNKIPGLSLRVNIEMERGGLDKGELGFSCYEHVEDVRTLKGSTEQLGPQSIVRNGHSNFAFQVEQSRM